MNHKFALLAVLIVLVFSACSSAEKNEAEIWEDGYKSGYSDGKFESDTEHEDDYANGYEDGYQDAASNYDLNHLHGISDELATLFGEIELEARYYSEQDLNTDIESALDTVYAYLNSTTNFFGEWPSKAEFEEAVNYLYNYSDFYYNRKYAD